MNRTNIFTALFFTLALFICAKGTWADQIAISMKPGVTEITAKPGTSVHQTVTVFNSGDPGVFTLRLYQADSIDIQGNLSLAPVKDPEIAIHMVDQPVQLNAPFLLDANSKQEFQLTIDVPLLPLEQFKQKEYIYTLIAESEKPLPVEGTVNTRISTGIGSTFVVRVLEQNVAQKQIVPLIFKIIGGVSIPMGKSRFTILDSNKPIPFLYQLKNKGDYSVQADAKMVLKNLITKKHQNYSFVPTQLYPNADRLIPAQHYDIALCEKTYGERYCDQRYSGILPPSFFGLYEASVKTTFGSESPMVYSSDIFMVIPYFLLGLIGISIVAAVLLLIRMWRNHLREATPSKMRKDSILR